MVFSAAAVAAAVVVDTAVEAAGFAAGDDGGEILLTRSFPSSMTPLSTLILLEEVDVDGDDTGRQTSAAAEVGAASDEGDFSAFFKPSKKHFEQHPPVASEPKKPHPFLHRVGTDDGGAVAWCCSLFSVLMVLW